MFLDSVIEGRAGVRRKEAALFLLVSLLAALLLAPAAVALQPTFGYAAVGYLAACLLILAAAGGRALWLVWGRPRREKVALEIEAERPDLGNNLISCLQLFPRKGALGPDDPTSPALIDALVQETAAQVKRLEGSAFVSTAGPRRLGRLSASMAGAVLLTGLLSPGLYPEASRLLTHAFELMPSRITHLRLTASAERVLAGMAVTFDLRAEGRIPEGADLEFFSLGGAEDREPLARLPMAKLGKGQEGRFRLKWTSGARGVRVRARTGRFRSRPLDVRVTPPPRMTKIEVVYFPPEYTGLNPQRGLRGGEIRAYLGSSVLVRVKASKPIREAVLALADGWRIPLKEAKDGFLEGLLLLGSPGSYQVRLKDRFGFTNPSPRRFRIDIIPDTPPHAQVISPRKDVTVEAGDEVRMRYLASDDFGVRRLGLEYWIGKGRRRRVSLDGGEGPRKQISGSHVFDLRALAMGPGASLRYRVVAEDTDTVSGPKRTASRVYHIRVRDREAVMATLDDRLKRISEKLLDLLASHLEEEAPELGKGETARRPAPLGGKEKGGERRAAGRSPSKVERAEGILNEIREARAMLRPQNPREALASMDLDLLQRRLFDTLERHLRPARRSGGKQARGGRKGERPRKEEADRREESTQALERIASMGEDIMRQLRMDRVGRMADSLLQRQRALARELERMRKSGVDPEAMRRVQEELERLRREMNKMLRQLSGLAQRMPSEFMNRRGMRNLPMQDMRQAFDRIREHLRRGDIRAALEAMRRLMSQMMRMRAALRGIRRRQMMAQRGTSPMRRRQSELSAILNEQQAILAETVNLQDMVIDRLKKGSDKALAALANLLRGTVEEERAREARAGAEECPPVEAPAAGLRGRVALPPVEDALEEADRALEAERAREERALARREALSETLDRIGRGEWATLHQRIPRYLEKLGVDACGRKVKEDRLRPWKSARKRLGRLLRKGERAASAAEKKSLRGLQDRQKALGKRLLPLEERLRSLMQIFPFLDSSILRRLTLARKAMGKAAGRLGALSPTGAVPPEEEAIRQLAQGQNSMMQAMQQMVRRGNLGRGSPRGAGAYRAPGLSWWARNPRLPGQQDASRPGEEEDGRLGTQFSEVLIPGRNQYQVPRKFREEVMEALKEGMPDSLRREIEDYFDRLTK